MKPLLLPALAWLLIGAAARPAETGQRVPDYQPPRIIRTIEPVFPETLLPTHRRGGKVDVLVRIDGAGRLTDWLVTRFTAAPFAAAAVEAVRQWKYEPAVLAGEPVPICLELHFSFEVKGVVVSVSPSEALEASFNDLTGGIQYAPCTLRELDRLPVPLEAVPPGYPEALAAQGAQGEVTVDFYIDESGAVRMPYVSGNAHPLLANLAVEAVRQWRFEPPTRQGRPVLVHVRQLFRFNRARPAGP